MSKDASLIVYLLRSQATPWQFLAMREEVYQKRRNGFVPYHVALTGSQLT